VLLNQFHDILPGSSISAVYQDQRRQHAEVLAEAGTVLAEAQEAIGRQIAAPDPTLVLFNSVPRYRAGVTEVALPAEFPDGLMPHQVDGTPLQVQPVTGMDGRPAMIVGLSVPAMGYTAYPLGPHPPAPADELLTVVAEERCIESGSLRLELDERGRFVSLYDKLDKREVLAPGGGGNRLLAFEDKPLDFDAWDIDPYYVEKCWEIDDVSDWRVVEHGPLRAGIEITRRWEGSTIRQRILIDAEEPQVVVRTHIDWHHRQVLLKAAFPLAVHAAHATYECAFGHVQRPTHRNTPWDAARFEVAAHRWADLSEAGYGVSLLNDGKYGHDCLGNVLRLTLLKSAIDPDPLADEGEHRFSYALLPHGPGWTIEDTVAAAYAFNMPVRARLIRGTSGSFPTREGLVTSDVHHALVDTVKLAEDGDGLIVRVYDCANRRGPVRLRFAHPLVSVVPVTILEEPDPDAGPVQVAGEEMAFDLLPFQVRSFRVRIGA
jgi:alpha-mannosidase